MASLAQNAPDGGISRSGEFEGPVDLTGVTEATFAIWVRWESEDGVAMSWVRDSDGEYMSLGLEGGRFRLYNGSLSAVYPTTPVAVLGQWYSVVVVTNSTGSALFVNGVSVGTGSVGFAGEEAGTFRLGGGPPGARVLDGYVVSGGIWDRKLGRAEVKAFHNKGVNLRYAGLPDAGKQLDERLYCLKDGMDPAAVIDEAGEVQERYAFTAFGRGIFQAPDYSARSSSAFDWDVLFHCELTDPETEWQNYGFRYYIAELGRWPKRDPLAERGGNNLYGYVENSPIDFLDILGLAEIWTFSGINSSVPGREIIDYVRETLEGKKPPFNDAAIWSGFGDPDLSISSNLGTGSPYKDSPDDELINVLNLRSKELLDREAQSVADDSIRQSQLCCKKIRVLMIAPKTATTWIKKPCCDLRAIIYWTPHDTVPNQEPTAVESASYWSAWGKVHTVDNRARRGPGPRGNHAFGSFFGENPSYHGRSRGGPLKGGGAIRAGSSEPRPTGSNAPDLRTYLNEWKSDDSIDVIVICHSQGCNIAIHVLNRGCTG